MISVRTRASTLWRGVRRAVLMRRRLLAALLTGVAVLAGIRATAAPPPPADPVLVAARDLSAGLVLAADDVRTAAFAEGTAPEGTVVVTDVVGRTLAAPLRAGEPVTDVRLVTAGLLEGYDDLGELVAVPVRIPDADAVALLRVGDRIDLLSTDPRGRGTERVAAGVPVLALPASSGEAGSLDAAGGLAGRLVVIGTSPAGAEAVADAAVQGFLSIVVGG